jgi:hypothetical protein
LTSVSGSLSVSSLLTSVSGSLSVSSLLTSVSISVSVSVSLLGGTLNSAAQKRAPLTLSSDRRNFYSIFILFYVTLSVRIVITCSMEA